ncbi:GntR family transcriptional repressor for pyruvate dehydrogenase complex [Arthrobacter pigmenti]|uniref:GntR family transcriptional repressor for pyruvate dehydrogenase complex n=1 Tax=Arthrobacter pigmenti TaxID=271432 RepID=A0A846RRQ6_9MICC|nr:GntR family transcriptional regulator [Arthrobacter pigmenti]NJC20991.1 GntR family transcriptional repressor for pyruvate dehydrogenase complex [Arthrobacter pigmenti]
MKLTLAASLVESLRRRIVDGTIPSGEKLPSESLLIAEFGVSRTVVREAISRLHAEGLVYTRRGSGSFALTPPASDESAGGMRRPRTLEERRALLAFRIGFESEAAALAAVHCTPERIAAMDEALAAFNAAGNHAATAMSCDFAFHRAVAEASSNAYFVDAVVSLGPAMIAMPPQRLEAAPDGGQSERLQRVAAEHGAVRNAIAAGDALAAAAAMRLHLTQSRQRLDAESGQGV